LIIDLFEGDDSSEELRYCKKCDELKSISEFRKYKRKEGKGFRYRCIACQDKVYKNFYYRHGKSEYHRKRKYNLTSEQFNILLRNQNHQCKICKKQLEKGRKTHVDHNHKTGKIRGVLCHNCNTALGHYEKYGNLFKEYLLNDNSYVQDNYKELIPSSAFLY
jgi:hypothetical protein